jgi:hypothetical protein
MLALVGTVMSRSPSGNVLLRYGYGVLGTHRRGAGSAAGTRRAAAHIVDLGVQVRAGLWPATLLDTPPKDTTVGRHRVERARPEA